jgi:hypothetical protein
MYFRSFPAEYLDGKFTAIGRRVSNVARQTTLAVVPKSGHIIHFESPDAYFGALRTFLSKRQENRPQKRPQKRPRKAPRKAPLE